MALVTTEATILKTYEYSETSKILRLFTRDAGLCSVIAKGARRPKSRFGGLLEPFTDGVATFYAKEGRELHTLSAFELGCERQTLGGQLVRYAGAGLLTEIVLRFAPSTADERLFAQLRRGLDRLVEEQGDVERAILEETWRMIESLGFAPSVEVCSVCNEPPPADQATHFDLANGGVVCNRCRPQVKHPNLLRLAPDERAELAELLSEAAARGRGQVEGGRTQRRLLREFIAYHLAEQRPLNSFRFLEGRLA
ncbi:MAG: DNA repair protein RecO [Gemmatimonadetes bacterium]|nr:DNA repair protein RecO [Gemmatimonadota bacterium]NIO32547.1 DNA repair protein RecO [Gemmatimonadota bacterium]